MAVKPLTEDERQAIIADLQAGTMSRKALVAKYKRSGQTISKIAKEAGIDMLARVDATTQLTLQRARETFEANSQERRAQLTAKMLARADHLMDRVVSPTKYHELDREAGDFVTITFDEPIPQDQAKLMQAARYAMQTAKEIAQLDEKGADQGAEIDGWLDGLSGR